MVYLERLDPLAKIGGVSADMDYIANPQRTALELDSRDGEVAVIVTTPMRSSDAACSAGGVGIGLTGIGLTAVDLAFLGDAPRRGAFFVACLLIVLVFLAAVVFLRVDTLTAAFLRFALVFPVAFFRVAITASLVSSWIPVAESLPKRSKSPGKEEHDTKADIGESGPDPYFRKLLSTIA